MFKLYVQCYNPTVYKTYKEAYEAYEEACLAFELVELYQVKGSSEVLLVSTFN